MLLIQQVDASTEFMTSNSVAWINLACASTFLVLLVLKLSGAMPIPIVWVIAPLFIPLGLMILASLVLAWFIVTYGKAATREIDSWLDEAERKHAP